MLFIQKYFRWLQKDTHMGDTEQYPEIDANGETSVKGIFITGDLTGVPLLKFASESGAKIIRYLNNEPSFLKDVKNNNEKDIYDIIIVGAGVSGVAAGFELLKENYSFKIIDSSRKFSTILNFPKGKPIYAEPEDYEPESELKIAGETKELLIDELNSQVKDKNLPIEEEVEINNINKKKSFFELETSGGIYKALRVIIATGKSGKARRLRVKGEDLPKVYNRLFDPADTQDEKVLVVGGGDSALETAIAVSDYAESTALSYRGSEFTRPKQGNIEKLNSLVEQGKIKLLMQSEVDAIKEDKVVIRKSDGKLIEIENSVVYTMLGTEIPTEFFKRAGIRMEKEMTPVNKLMFAELVLAACVIYFGKSGPQAASIINQFKTNSWTDALSKLFSGEFLSSFLIKSPAEYWQLLISSRWYRGLEGFLYHFAFIAAVVMGIYLIFHFIKNYKNYFTGKWQVIKYSYLFMAVTFFFIIFFGSRYFDLHLFGESPSFYYTFLYSLTILIFGLRRIHVRPTRYIKLQTWSLMLIQIIPLFLLPEIILPALGKLGLLGGPDSFISTQVFPNHSYWRSYGFILAWPLNLGNLYNGNITTFWLVFSLVQTFVFIPAIIYFWGKGAYCGWICSCGALAETMGNEYRHKMPHGAGPKKLEFAGQWVLLFAIIITAAKLLAITLNFEIPLIHSNLDEATTTGRHIYQVIVDIIFAGVLGLGVYFFLSGRVWCRFLCPLAALMHIYSRFSRYRIFPEKKKCISCNICTKVCHMGIDVMNYANKGIPMNDVECVSCSACIVNCPTEVLTFGMLPKTDTDNKLYQKINAEGFPKEHWASGL